MPERKEKFTPGPWKAAVRVEDDVNILTIYGINSITEIGALCPQDSIEETKSNAALISAAPEMYDALKSECVSCQLRDHETNCEECKIGKALKKARGEE